MPPYAARLYSAMVADGSQEIYERFVNELMSRMHDPYNLVDVGCGPGHVTELLAKRLPQGKIESKKRAERMINQMEQEGFGSCSNHRHCETVCPKEISVSNIAAMNKIL